jgi:short-subunit dehydrogenase
MDVRGKTVLLTGASTGLGPYIARRLRRGGAKFVLSARNEEALNKLAADLGDSRVVVADLSRSGEAERLAEQAGPIDVLVSNAGIPASGRLITFTVDELDRAIAVNVRAGIVLARLLLPGMLERRSGHMVFLSSIAGRIAGPGFGVYSATKFAVRGFALALRAELWGTGVGVSVIYPTFVKESGMWAETGLKPNPIAGEVTPAQVAEAVFSAVRRNRGEVNVMPLQLRATIKLQDVAPGLFGTIARATGASAVEDAVGERQRNKR